MTVKQYYQEPGKIEFEAQVVEVVADKKKWKVLLDQTCFYPEGGGQPADRGSLGGVPVVDVQKEGELIYHYLSQSLGADWVKGKAIMGIIDSKWRMDFMQQHTGQHVISAAFWKVGNYPTVSVHMGLDYTAIEIAVPEISDEDLRKVEETANQSIAADLPVNCFLVSHTDLDKYPLRKPHNRTGDIRLVQIGDFDCVACGGLHVERTHKIQLVKAIGREKIRGNIRIRWKIGERAIEDYIQKDCIISRLRFLLSTGEDMFERKIGELLEELSLLKQKINTIENKRVETGLPELLKDAYYPQGSDCKIIATSFSDEEDSFIKKVIKELLKQEKMLVCLINVSNGKLQWNIGCSEGVSFPFDEVKGQLLPLIDGRGGGRFPFWQGAGTKPENGGDFLTVFRTLAVEFICNPMEGSTVCSE